MTSAEVSQVLDYMPYGLYVIGSKMDSECNGMMADWVMQASFKPHMLAAALENDAQTLANIRQSGVFTINFLSQGIRGMRLAGRFAQPYLASKISGQRAGVVHHKLEVSDFTPSGSGCPILTEAMAWVECRAANFVAAGDHTIVIGEVLDGRLVHADEPLTSTFTGWKYSG